MVPYRPFLLVFLLLAIPAGATAADEVSLRLKWLPQFQFAGYYVARDQGFYEDVDLDVAINPGGADISARATVASGADEFGVGSPGDFFIAAERGLALTGLMATFQRSATGFMVKADSGIEGPKDFEGHAVAVTYGELTEIEYRAMLDKADADASRIREVKKQYNLAPFLQDRIHVWTSYISNEPFSARQNGAEVRVLRPADYGVNFYGDTLFAKTEYVEAHPDITRRFVQASQRGWAYALRHPEEAKAIVARYASARSAEHLAFEAEQILGLLESEDTLRYGLGWQDAQRYAFVRDTLLETGMIEKSAPVEAVMTNEFLLPQ